MHVGMIYDHSTSRIVVLGRSKLLKTSEAQLSEMYKEKAAWLKAQKTQQAQVSIRVLNAPGHKS